MLLKAMMDKSPYEARELIRSHTVDQFDHLLKHLLVQYDDVPKALLNSLAPVYGLAPAQVPDLGTRSEFHVFLFV